MNIHDEFILTPVSSILKEMVIATRGIGHGLEVYPLSEYILQSTFIRMTGQQEQKLKCIAWVMATYDFEYRIQFSANSDRGFSRYSDKNSLFKEIIGNIKKIDPDFNVSYLYNSDIIYKTKTEIETILDHSTIQIINDRLFYYFKKFELIEGDGIIHSNSKKPTLELIRKAKSEKTPYLFNIYESLYRQRNRIAHNTLSYQKKVPKLDVFKEKNLFIENYFIWFFLIALIDNIFMDLFKRFINNVNNEVL